MSKEEVLRALYDLSEDDLQEVSREAHNLAWNMRALGVTAQHDQHVEKRLLAEGCFKCFPNGERVGG